MGNNGKRQHKTRSTSKQWKMLTEQIKEAEYLLFDLQLSGESGGFVPDLTQQELDSLIVKRVKLISKQ